MHCNPLQFWADYWSTARSMGRWVQQMGEIAAASQDVIGRRSWIIAEAASNPLDGDYAEISRMVPEKVVAFGRAQQALLEGLTAMQAQALAAWATGWPAMDMPASVFRDAVRTAERAIEPIHETSTGNAQRLKGEPR